MKYNFNDIKETYKRIGVRKGMIINLKTDLRYLGPYSSNSQNDVLEAHFNILADLVDVELPDSAFAINSLKQKDIDFLKRES